MEERSSTSTVKEMITQSSATAENCASYALELIKLAITKDTYKEPPGEVPPQERTQQLG